VFENRVVRRTFGPKMDEVTGGWRKLHNEDLHNLYSSPSIIRMMKSRRMRWAGHVAQIGDKRNPYRILMGKSERERLLRSPRRRWVDNITIDLRGIGWDDMDWIDLAQDRDQWRNLVNTVMNRRVLYNFEKYLSSCTTIGFSRSANTKLLICHKCEPFDDWPTQPPLQSVAGVKQQKWEADHSLPSNAEVKNGGAIFPHNRESSCHGA
jgi:hypothetical protein